MNPSRNKRIIISGGGTGGHVFPAIAIADALNTEREGMEILFVGACGKMEMDKVPQAGYQIIGLPVEGFQRKLSLSNIRVVVKGLRSLRKAGSVIREFRPDVVVGVGGYASGPVLRRAAAMGIPTLLQEQNSYAGVTNRLLARKARRICVAYEGMERYFPAGKIILTGNPVRREIRDLDPDGDRSKARAVFGLNPPDRVLLVVGGSLGARTINRAVGAGLHKLLQLSGISLIWQCGRIYHDEAREVVEKHPGARIVLKDFIDRMDLAYQAADVVIARAGAITISELCQAARPAILVPSPNVAEDHQTRNARYLVERSAALLVPDDQSEDSLMEQAVELLGDEDRKRELSKNIAGMARPDAAAAIAGEIISLLEA
jgi:UDP-N-acetylglucosamine--N-acetylmuramyl-(pentapeptide) pyrophosphoryl-undecaprenol N-acetylglucosamine transferase